MNCPKCGGNSKKNKHLKDGGSAYRQLKCIECGNLFHTKVTVSETLCSKEEFLIRQRKNDEGKYRDKYRRKCMRMYQAI